MDTTKPLSTTKISASNVMTIALLVLPTVTNAPLAQPTVSSTKAKPNVTRPVQTDFSAMHPPKPASPVQRIARPVYRARLTARPVQILYKTKPPRNCKATVVSMPARTVSMRQKLTRCYNVSIVIALVPLVNRPVSTV